MGASARVVMDNDLQVMAALLRIDEVGWGVCRDHMYRDATILQEETHPVIILSSHQTPSKK